MDRWYLEILLAEFLRNLFDFFSSVSDAKASHLENETAKDVNQREAIRKKLKEKLQVGKRELNRGGVTWVDSGAFQERVRSELEMSVIFSLHWKTWIFFPK